MSLDDATEPLAEQVAAFRERYTGRRTVPWEMLTECERLIRTSAQYHGAELVRVQETHAANLAALRSTIEHQRSTIDSLKRQLDERRSLNEARRDAGDGDAEVTIRRDDYLRAWRLSDLEEIAYRLRCGGAVDDTPVDMASNRAIAIVPAPNLVTLEHRAALPEPTLPDPGRVATSHRLLAKIDALFRDERGYFMSAACLAIVFGALTFSFLFVVLR